MDYILIIDKPRGITSYEAIKRLKFEDKNIKKIGHAGTLDPMAEGVLIALINNATKLSDDIMHSEKTYLVEMILGYETDTLDLEGKIVNQTSSLKYSDNEIIQIISSYSKEYDQIPPKYSAIKINGKKLYELARNNIEIDEIKSRKVKVEISDIKILEQPKYKSDNLYPIYYDKILKVIEFRAKVSSGTYIRSLVRDISYSLNCFGVMSRLIRESIKNFNLDDKNRPIGLEEIYHKYKFNVDRLKFKRLSDGLTQFIENDKKYELKIGEILSIFYDNEFVMLAKILEIDKTKLKIQKYKYIKMR